MMTKIIKIKQISQNFFLNRQYFFLPFENLYLVGGFSYIVLDGNISIICDAW